jgi:hypothetical protein
MKDTNDEFIAEYKELCLKYGRYIESCSCCDSPWIEIIDPNDKYPYFENMIEHISRRGNERFPE